MLRWIKNKGRTFKLSANTRISSIAAFFCAGDGSTKWKLMFTLSEIFARAITKSNMNYIWSSFDYNFLNIDFPAKKNLPLRNNKLRLYCTLEKLMGHMLLVFPVPCAPKWYNWGHIRQTFQFHTILFRHVQRNLYQISVLLALTLVLMRQKKTKAVIDTHIAFLIWYSYY